MTNENACKQKLSIKRKEIQSYSVHNQKSNFKQELNDISIATTELIEIKNVLQNSLKDQKSHQNHPLSQLHCDQSPLFPLCFLLIWQPY